MFATCLQIGQDLWDAAGCGMTDNGENAIPFWFPPSSPVAVLAEVTSSILSLKEDGMSVEVVDEVQVCVRSPFIYKSLHSFGAAHPVVVKNHDAT